MVIIRWLCIRGSTGRRGRVVFRGRVGRGGLFFKGTVKKRDCKKKETYIGTVVKLGTTNHVVGHVAVVVCVVVGQWLLRLLLLLPSDGVANGDFFLISKNGTF